MSDVLFRCRTSLAVPVNDVLIRIYDDTDTLVTTGTTGEGANPDGERLFNLDADEYTARFSMIGSAYTIISPQAFTVVGDDTDSFDITVTLHTRPPATDAQLCRCSGYIRDLNGAPLKGATVTFEGRVFPVFLGNDLVGSDRTRVVTDSRGYAQIDLIRTAIYRVVAPGYTDLTMEIEIPNASSANLPDVIFPIVSAIIFGSGTMTLAAGASGTTSAVVGYRSGLLKAVGDFSTCPVSFVSSNEAVAKVSVVDEGVKISAIAAGTATITVERVVEDEDNAITSIPNLPAVTGSITVTVT